MECLFCGKKYEDLEYNYHRYKECNPPDHGYVDTFVSIDNYNQFKNNLVKSGIYRYKECFLPEYEEYLITYEMNH